MIIENSADNIENLRLTISGDVWKEPLKKVEGENMQGKISVIIPVYNTAKFLDQCISSVVNQTYDNLEIILIDDGSTDDSYAICCRWAKTDARITFTVAPTDATSK